MRYKDEKYVEALEDEVKALRARVEALGGRSRGSGVGSGGRTGRTTGRGAGSAVEAEEMMRRARTEVAAEAGAGYGRVSLEALYLLPTEFTNVYQRLFLQALKESPGQTNDGGAVLVKRPPQLTRGKVVKDGPNEGKVLGVEVPLDRDPDRGGGSARGGGKRHRDHWLIKDERAFRLKGVVDRELRELANVVARELGKSRVSSRAPGKSGPTGLDDSNSSNASNGSNATPQCAGCQRFLKVTWTFCPTCGVARPK